MTRSYESPSTQQDTTAQPLSAIGGQGAALPASHAVYRFLARSPHPLARFARTVARLVDDFSLSLPAWAARMLLAGFLAGRLVLHFVLRVFVCEPLFKAYCTKYGKRLHTSTHIHWIEGRGAMIVGDDVKVDGKCTFSFARRLGGLPTLKIGDGTIIGHGCSFVVARHIEIGANCLLAIGVQIFDSPGHSNDPERRLRGQPSLEEEVRPVVIGDNVWIGSHAIILPGTTIGHGSVVAVGSVVRGDVPPMAMVAGYPARKIADLRPASAAQPNARDAS